MTFDTPTTTTHTHTRTHTHYTHYTHTQTHTTHYTHLKLFECSENATVCGTGHRPNWDYCITITGLWNV